MSRKSVHGGIIPAHAGKTRAACPCRGSARDHPRSRGENPTPPAHLLLAHGSSPLTRGKQPTRPCVRTWGGLIPAHAGKTCLFSSASCSWWDHPRSRGENRFAFGARSGIDGSSPLTRGKHHPRLCLGVPAGLIPAHAGKTERRTKAGTSRTAHPRSRGENRRTWNLDPIPAGSSPLTRGKPGRGQVSGGALRIIPAHAGKTCLFSSASCSWWDHPRSRGENMRG